MEGEAHGSARFCGIRESRGDRQLRAATLGKSRDAEKTKFRRIARVTPTIWTKRNRKKENGVEERRADRKNGEEKKEKEARGTTGKVSSNSKAVESRKNRRNEDVR